MKKILIWWTFICSLVCLGTVLYIDYEKDKIVWNKIMGLEDRHIILEGQTVMFKDGSYGMISLDILVEDEKDNIQDMDYIFKDSLVKVSSVISPNSIDDLLSSYKKEFIAIGKEYDISIKDVYISSYVKK